MIRLISVTSMFPPHKHRTTFLPSKPSDRIDSPVPDLSRGPIAAAKGVAAAPSTTIFSNSSNRRMAAAICGSSTSTSSSTTFLGADVEAERADLRHRQPVGQRRAGLYPRHPPGIE